MNTKNKKYLALAMSVLTLQSCSSPELAEKTNTTTLPVADIRQPLSSSVSESLPNYLSRDIKDEVFYFVMPDRFHNAKPENDEGDPSRPISYGGLDKTSKWAFHGGDIAGVEAKLDYLQGLGVTSIWMTPILRNKAVQKDGFGHHGYWVVDFTEIDPHFGSNDDLKNLIHKAHERNIKVFFDIIANHTADVIKYEECHNPQGKYLQPDQKGCDYLSPEELAQGKSYSPFVPVKEQGSKVPAWLNDSKYYNNRGDTFWEGESAIKGDFAGLDDIDTSQEEVIQGLTEIFKNLVTEFKPDGFRIDTVKHVDIEFWQSFSPDLIAHAKAIGIPQFFMFGEVYDGNPAGLSKYTTIGKLQSVLDFGFAFNVKDVVFNQKDVSQLAELVKNDDYFRDGDSTPNDLLTFLGNHDMGRAGNFIESSSADFDENGKLKLSQIAHALMYFYRGVPVVYYGDEQGFTGDGGDVDAREDMDPSQVVVYNDNNLLGANVTTAADNFDVQHPLYATLSELSNIRLAHPSLRKGVQVNRLIDNGKQVYGFSRIDLDSESNNFMQDYLLVFNLGDQEQKVNVNHDGLTYEQVAGDKVSVASHQLHFNLPPYSYSIVRSKTPRISSKITEVSLAKIHDENDRRIIPINVEFENPDQLNIAKISFYKHLGNGEKQLFAYDTTLPYRAVVPFDVLADIEEITVEATNFSGQRLSKTFRLLQ
jgi:glycosidase